MWCVVWRWAWRPASTPPLEPRTERWACLSIFLSNYLLGGWEWGLVIGGKEEELVKDWGVNIPNSEQKSSIRRAKNSWKVQDFKNGRNISKLRESAEISAVRYTNLNGNSNSIYMRVQVIGEYRGHLLALTGDVDINLSGTNKTLMNVKFAWLQD